MTVPISVSWLTLYLFLDCLYIYFLTVPISISWLSLFLFLDCPYMFLDCPYMFLDCPYICFMTVPISVSWLSLYVSCLSLVFSWLPLDFFLDCLYMFLDCPYICFLTVPISVSWLSRYLFLDCPYICFLTVPVSVSWLSRYLFLDCPYFCFLTVPRFFSWLSLDWWSNLHAVFHCYPYQSLSICLSVCCPYLFSFPAKMSLNFAFRKAVACSSGWERMQQVAQGVNFFLHCPKGNYSSLFFWQDGFWVMTGISMGFGGLFVNSRHFIFPASTSVK